VRRLVAGCGPKAVASEAIGLDIDVGFLRRAKELSPGVPVVAADARALPFGDDAFDEVVCWEVLEHIEDKDRVLSEFHRVLRPGAAFVMSMPLRSIEEFLGRLSRSYRTTVLSTQHRFCVSPGQTLELVQPYFDVQRVWFAPAAFAYCLGATLLLDAFRVQFNEAGELVGANSRHVHRLATWFMQGTSPLFGFVNRVRPHWATKSICIVATCRKPGDRRARGA
jgi:SAM-dependent methyltransferase